MLKIYTLNLYTPLLKCAVFMAALYGNLTPVAEAKERTYEAQPELMLSELNAEIVKKNPQSALLLKDKSIWKHPDTVLALLQHNVDLYHYLPDTLRQHPEIIQAAKSLGIPTGVMLLKDRKARVEPSLEAAVSLGPSDTTNGYLVEKRPEMGFKKGDRVPVFNRKTVNGEGWLQISKKKSYPRDQAREDYQMLSNVGGVAFKDFGFARDAGWIPESQTQEALLSRQVKSGLLHFEGVENGDLAVYVTFREKSFSDFSESAYVILSAMEKGQLNTGDKVRVIWEEPLTSNEEATLDWVAIPTSP